MSGSLLPGLAGHPWAYPALEVVHLIGLGLLVGNLMLLELRVWGFGPALPVRELSRLALSLVLLGFALSGASGLLMFATRPQELLANPAFTLKMVLLSLAGLNAAWFHVRGSLERLDRTARALMLASGFLWVAILACGRWIAYR
jgi:hypothetical protein